ncbi:MAG: pirin family protein [Bacteroidota bacterium]
MKNKSLIRVVGSTKAQVGDGFTIRRALPAPGLEMLDPFLMLDHAGPVEIEPSEIQKGVDAHPHKGFETVTILYQGELEHRDSSGNSGKIHAGGAQWMTAGSGIVHEEKHGQEFSRRGGTVELVQLWVNLPKKFKLTSPDYQDLKPEDIPGLALPEGAGTLRIIAGDYDQQQGAARTFTPINLYDLRLNQGADTALSLPEGFSTGVYVVRGKVAFNGGESISAGFMALFDPQGEQISIQAEADSILLVLNGEPIDEPVVSYGPFVMNTEEEIREAYREFRKGKMGTL